MQTIRVIIRALALVGTLLVAGVAHAACGVATPNAANLGSYSPNALKAGAVPYVGTFGGFSCTSNAVLVLLSTNFLKATVANGSVLKLTSTTTADTVAYQLSAGADGSIPLAPGVAGYYVNGTTLNVVGLFGSSPVNVPVYARLSSATTIAPGTYTGSVAIKWDWYFCSLVGALNACIGTLDSGSQTATINFTLTVAARPATMTISSVTTWDPVSNTTDPKAIPKSRRRTAMTIVNNDIVPLDLNTLTLALPTGAGTILALDGDGTGSGPVVQTTQGTPASTLTLAYAAPASTADDVDFSSDGGASWTYVPVAGDLVSEAAVSHVRFAPKGSMAAQSSFTISIPYLVK